MLAQAPLLAWEWEAERAHLIRGRTWFCGCLTVSLNRIQQRALRGFYSLPACHFLVARACHAVGNKIKIWIDGKPWAPPLASEMLQVLTGTLTAETVMLPEEAIKGTEKASGFPCTSWLEKASPPVVRCEISNSAMCCAPAEVLVWSNKTQMYTFRCLRGGCVHGGCLGKPENTLFKSVTCGFSGFN